MKRIGFLSAVVVAAVTLGCNGNDDRTADNDTAVGAGTGAAANRDEVTAGARDWVNDRLVGGMTEVELGQLASQKATDADVKAFGTMMAADHTKAGESLKGVATQHNIPTPTGVDAEHRDTIDRLSKLQGADFDREYMQVMVDSHQRTLEALEDRVNTEGSSENPVYTADADDNRVDAALNQWAAAAAPTVHKHLTRAKELNDKVGRRRTE
jgi:putative membrane protein